MKEITEPRAGVVIDLVRPVDAQPESLGSGALLASKAMSESLAELRAEAQAAGLGVSARAAFSSWQADASSSTGAERDWDVFASEAAFAAAARICVETLSGEPRSVMSSFLPHLYRSEPFSWFEPTSERRTELASQFGAAEDVDAAELLGWLYQFSIPEQVRKRFGQFYTQPAIVEGMLDSLGFEGEGILKERLIDPAVGAGAFAIAASKRVIAAAEESGLEGTAVCKAVQSVIHGLDLNPLGILLTEAAIALLLVPHLRQASEDAVLDPLHLYVTDSLEAGGLLGADENDHATRIKMRLGGYETGFDYVVANPPYAKYPSRLLTAQQRQRFSDTTYGHANLYGLFLQVGVELLADGGRLSFINPRSFVSGLYFKNLRKFLSDHLDLERFDGFDQRTGLFDGVLQDVVILTGEKRSGRKSEVELREFAGPPQGKPVRKVFVSRKSVLLNSRFDHAYFISADPLAHDLLARMLDDTLALAELGFKVATGTIVWNRLKALMRDEKSTDTLPLIWGNGIRPFSFLGPGNRSGLASHLQLDAKTRGIVSRGPALLVKRMTAKEETRRIVACRVPAQLEDDPSGYFAENHVNLIRPAGKPTVELDAVLGLLNSRLYDYVFRSLNGNTQVSASELSMLPVKRGPELALIAGEVRKLQAGGGDLTIATRIDGLVAQLFNLNDEDVERLAASYEPAVAH